MTKVAMVIKIDKQGCGKGLIIDELFGEYIFGSRSYTQVKSMEGLLGHFNGDLQNTLLVNVNEVYMTKKDANAIKTMITDPKIKIEEKYLNKIDASNKISFVLTSNNEYCVVLDKGNSDRRYFIVDCDCSLANNQEYYSTFAPYCRNKETHINVYKYFKGLDLGIFLPCKAIPDTEIKKNTKCM